MMDRRSTRRWLLVGAYFVIAAVFRRRGYLQNQVEEAGAAQKAAEPPPQTAFLALDEKDGRYCGKDGDICKCFGRVRYGRLFAWSDDIVSDGQVECSAKNFGGAVAMDAKICKCYPSICTTDQSTCTPEPCQCPTSRNAEMTWAKKTLMTSDGVKCWNCEKTLSSPSEAIDDDSKYCPAMPGRCTMKRSCKCKDPMDRKRVTRTKDGEKCWTCAPPDDGMQKSGGGGMFWMLPLMWPFMDFPKSAYRVFTSCITMGTFLLLCVVGYIFQNFVPFLNLNRWFSFYAPTLKKGEFWRLFTYFMVHSDIQHLCINLMHLLDALDLEGVPAIEVSAGNPLKCTRDFSGGAICYPDVGIGRDHLMALIGVVLAFGALVGTIKQFGALTQGASSVCFGVDGALIAMYGMFLGAELDSQLPIPEFGSFFWMRIGIIMFHIIIDVVQSLCGPAGTVGTTAHMASLVAGFCYVILMLPPMGDGSLFQGLRPYIVPCGMTSPTYTNVEDATGECLAFFRRGNGVRVETAQTAAMVILGGGVIIAAINAFRKRHISDDGIALCQCGSMDSDGGDAHARQEIEMREQLKEKNKVLKAQREDVTRLERLLGNMPDVTAPALAN